MTKRNADADAAVQYLTWALEHIERVGGQKAAHLARLALEEVRKITAKPDEAAPSTTDVPAK
ncbi:hypothetical protein JQ636_37935 [Bradyrhizobium japonicum]|uniref:hypothetical protein n=1 Tax=Bradyrhizobium japonicum TaxID=375 RepID=UPI001BAC47E4|nr:hypothetical protein [Bradyrhizobium japonicum]MBR0809344.1 hypothetical protein [Bradyrhizobium japonicum]